MFKNRKIEQEVIAKIKTILYTLLVHNVFGFGAAVNYSVSLEAVSLKFSVIFRRNRSKDCKLQ
jgi:hypothetical protein